MSIIELRGLEAPCEQSLAVSKILNMAISIKGSAFWIPSLLVAVNIGAYLEHLGASAWVPTCRRKFDRLLSRDAQSPVFCAVTE